MLSVIRLVVCRKSCLHLQALYAPLLCSKVSFYMIEYSKPLYRGCGSYTRRFQQRLLCDYIFHLQGHTLLAQHCFSIATASALSLFPSASVTGIDSAFVSHSRAFALSFTRR